MKKAVKILEVIVRYVLAAMCLLVAALFIDKSDCVIFFALAFMLLPTFKLLCKLTNKKFTGWREDLLGIGMLIIPILLCELPEKAVFEDYLEVTIVIIWYWATMFAFNEQEYENKEIKEVDEENKTC